MEKPDAPDTRALSVRDQTFYVRRFAVAVKSGPDKGTRVISSGDELSIGTDEGNDLRLADKAVSRHHMVLRVHKRGLQLRDLGSTNGTFVGDIELTDGFVRSGAVLKIGRSTIAIEVLDDEIAQPLPAGDRFGELLGKSPVMRRLIPMLEQYATSSASLLIMGETGTGKEVAAESVHQEGDRRDMPFVVVDCGALPGQLLESELFGHVRGAFTGAESDRIGAFKAADGGTLFLDEIGELPKPLQPVLLRVLESRRFRRVGGSDEKAVDVRVIAATNRDLRTEVNEKRFRADLYFRLNVLRLELPPLRERGDDVLLLAETFWRTHRPDAPFPSDLHADFRRASWPGNVRELRNAVERAALIGWSQPTPNAGDELTTFAEAKDAAVFSFERDYVERLLSHTGGNLTRAAKIAKMSRSHLRLVMQKLAIEREDFVAS